MQRFMLLIVENIVDIIMGICDQRTSRYRVTAARQATAAMFNRMSVFVFLIFIP